MITFTGVRSDAEQLKKAKEHPGYRPDDKSNPLHRQLIGYIGLFLPVILIFMAVFRDGVEQWRSLRSVSAYYYSGAVVAFVGMLVALSLFLFTYRGFRNKHYRAERVVSIIAAVAALVVAIFPTGAPEGVDPLSWWTPLSGILHLVFAILLFLLFAVFALFLFPIKAREMKVRPGKRRRNRVYYSCGIVILASIAWAGINGRLGKSIFWPESIALAAFAISWLVKGRAIAGFVNRIRSRRQWKAALKK